jgi:hypothetical protein
MDSNTLHNLLAQLSSDDPAQRETARMALFALDEEAVNLLADEFYAGVSEALGVAILDIVGEIGGPDALSMLRNVYHFEDKRVSWRKAAARGLLMNRDNLDTAEVEEVERNQQDMSE